MQGTKSNAAISQRNCVLIHIKMEVRRKEIKTILSERKLSSFTEPLIRQTDENWL